MARQRFLVPLDFSEYANQALDYAIHLASQLDARLTLLHVVQSLPFGGVDMGATLPYTLLQDLEAEVTCRMESSLERVTAAGLEGDITVAHGVPFHAIIETAKTQQVDLIIMGTHGRTGFQYVLCARAKEWRDEAVESQTAEAAGERSRRRRGPLAMARRRGGQHEAELHADALRLLAEADSDENVQRR